MRYEADRLPKMALAELRLSPGLVHECVLVCNFCKEWSVSFDIGESIHMQMMFDHYVTFHPLLLKIVEQTNAE